MADSYVAVQLSVIGVAFKALSTQKWLDSMHSQMLTVTLSTVSLEVTGWADMFVYAGMLLTLMILKGIFIVCLVTTMPVVSTDELILPCMY